MKKRLFSLLCVLTLLLGALPSAAALEGESRRAAETLAELHLLSSVPTEKALRTAATRQQATELLVRFYGVTPAQREVSPQEYAVSKGWVTVTGGQQDAVPTDEVCASLLRQLGYEDLGAGSPALLARRIGLTYRDYEETLTSGDLCQLMRDALTFPDAQGVTAAQRLVEAGVCTQKDVQDLFPESLTARQTADRYLSAVFSIDTFYSEDHYKKGRIDSGGSGFFVSESGLALTNYHTIERSVRATVTLITGETFPVESVVYHDPDLDLALLRVSKTTVEGRTTTPRFAALELSEDPDLRPGDKVYTLGVPLGLTLAISDGIVSAVNHTTERFTLPCIVNTADISHGSSGGALMDVCGRVVGVTTGAYEGGNNLYISVPVAPVLEADWTAEGLTLAQVLAQALANE